LKLGIASHCTIDSLNIKNKEYETPGGAACYAGITASLMVLHLLRYPFWNTKNKISGKKKGKGKTTLINYLFSYKL